MKMPSRKEGLCRRANRQKYLKLLASLKRDTENTGSVREARKKSSVSSLNMTRRQLLKDTDHSEILHS